jgi:hypothetical protein
MQIAGVSSIEDPPANYFLLSEQALQRRARAAYNTPPRNKRPSVLCIYIKDNILIIIRKKYF